MALKVRPLVLSKDSIKYGKVVHRCFADYFNARLKPKQKVALLLSGGIDSTAVGLSLHDLGHKVHAYTFQLGDTTSEDSYWAQHTARIMNWEFTLIKCPEPVHYMTREWPFLYNDLGCYRKVQFECVWPMLFIYRKIAERYVASGLAADSYFGLSRKAFKSGSTQDKAPFDKARHDMFDRVLKHGHKALMPTYSPSCMYQMIELAKLHKLTDLNPYVDQALFNHFLKFNWEQLNKPRQKHHIVGAFPEYFQAIGHRKHANFQLVADIDHHFDKLLATPLNFRKRKRTLDMYGDWRRYPNEAKTALIHLRATYRHHKS